MTNPMRWLLIALTATALQLPQQSDAQYFSRLYDLDSSTDVGSGIIRQSNGNLFLFCSGVTYNSKPTAGSLILSGDASQIVQKHFLKQYPYYVTHYNNVLKSLPGDQYIAVVNVETATSLSAAFIKFNNVGDTVFIKGCTDTATDFEVAQNMAIAANGDFIVCGINGSKASRSLYSAVLFRTDSLGNIKWRKVYRKSQVRNCEISSVEELPDGRLLIGATSLTGRNMQGDVYYNAAPWLMITDSMGNVLKEHTLPDKYGYGRAPRIYTDKNGGYRLYGAMDTLLKPNDPLNNTNFPSYIARLDTNFSITWIRNFADTSLSSTLNHVLQLQNGNYLLMGSKGLYWKDNGNPATAGWLTHLSSSGNILWNRIYHKDTTYSQGFADGIALTDNSMVLVGRARSRSVPNLRFHDVWIVGVDSNGCEVAGCSTLKAPTSKLSESGISLYPNPTAGTFTFTCTADGTLHIVDQRGSEVAKRSMIKGNNLITMPPAAAGVYYAKFQNAGTGEVLVTKFTYQP